MSRHETIGHYNATNHPANVPPRIVVARNQGLRDLAAARQEVDRLKGLRPLCPEDAGRALFELRAAASALVDAIDRI